MASAFAHAIAGAALWPLLRSSDAPRYTWGVGAALAVIPDIDVVGFRLGIPYDALLGHRGLTHSLIVAALVGSLAAWVFTRRNNHTRTRWAVGAYLTLAMASHGLLDAMTTGGLGVALFAPIENTRYFFPWRPIAVSPIGITPFLTTRGLSVLTNEAAWVGLPSLAIAIVGAIVRSRLVSRGARPA